jgi:radical SAM protein with 4Fe4S-binding SPASM domain
LASLAYKLRLLRGLLSGEIARAEPFLVLVDTTRRCNLRCPGCRYHSPELERRGPSGRMDFDPELFERLCGQLEAMGTSELILTGDGEPFLHPDLLRMVRIAGEGPFHTNLFTNGTLLEESSVRSLIESGLDVLTVSLWASREEDYGLNYPETDPATFETVVENLRLVSGLKREARHGRPTLRLYHPICRRNVRGLDRMGDLAEETGCDELHFSPFRARRGRLDALALTAEDLERLPHDLGRIASRLEARGIATNVGHVLRRYRMGEDAWRKMPCYVGWVQAHVKPDGSVHPCNSCELSMGNVGDETFAEIWNGPAFRRFRRDMMRRDGRAGIADSLDCGYCGQLPDNRRVHRVFRWFARFRGV